MADALSENDLQGKKFLKLANDLKEGSLSDAAQSNLIRLTNTKVKLNNIIQIQCMAVAGKLYMIEFNCFKEGYYTPVDEKTLKKENIKDYGSIK